MNQEVNNKGEINSQFNVGNIEGNVSFVKKTRLAKRFEKLNLEVASDAKYEGIMESLKLYITKLDGINMPTKLKDGGFNEREIVDATKKKERYAKQLERNKFFESAQWIDNHLFGIIKMYFEAYVLPLVNNGATKDEILREVVLKVIEPVLELINIDGENDDFLNYNADDIFGMVYYLTGQCHLNWKNYDCI